MKTYVSYGTLHFSVMVESNSKTILNLNLKMEHANVRRAMTAHCVCVGRDSRAFVSTGVGRLGFMTRGMNKIDSCCSKTKKYISNIMDLVEIINNVIRV